VQGYIREIGTIWFGFSDGLPYIVMLSWSLSVCPVELRLESCKICPSSSRRVCPNKKKN